MRILLTLLLTFTSTFLFSQTLDQGLIAHYTFSGDADDVSGNGNDGVVFDAVLTEDRFGNAGSAYLFNGTDTYISIPSSTSLESPDTAITMSAWISPAGFSLIGDGFGPVLMKSNSQNNSFMYRMDIYTDGLAAALNNWNSSTISLYEVQFNEWHHIAVSFCGTEVKFYMDNTLLSEEAYVTNITPNDLPLEIGRDVPGVLEVFNGAIDDVRIYDRCVTDQEISEIFLEDLTSVASIQPNTFTLSPNPASESVTLRSHEQNTFQHIQLIDMLGRVTLEQRFAPVSIKEIDLSGLNKGIYTLQIMDGKSINSTPLVIE